MQLHVTSLAPDFMWELLAPTVSQSECHFPKFGPIRVATPKLPQFGNQQSLGVQPCRKSQVGSGLEQVIAIDCWSLEGPLIHSYQVFPGEAAKGFFPRSTWDIYHLDM